MTLLRRIRSWFGRRRLDDGLRDELEFHRAELQRALEAQGVNPDEAARESRRRLGNVALAREDAREVWIWRWLDTTRQDVTYALRGMRKAPGFTLAVVLTLALGIGANTAVFSLLDALVLRALPVRDPGSLVEMVWTYPGDPPMDLFDWEEYERVRASNQVFSAVIGFQPGAVPVAIDGVNAVPLETVVVTATFFQELGVQPALGRAIGPADDTTARAAVAMISWRTWKDRFGLDPSVLGRQIVINKTPVAIVGVAPEAFTGVAPGLQAEIWVPVALTPRIAPHTEFPSGVGLALMARLRPGVSIEQARAQMHVLDRPRIDALSARDPQWRKVAVDVQPAGTGLSMLRDQFGVPVLMLMGMVGLLLLIACTNLAGLQLSRGFARRPEMAVRAALGGGRGRLLRHLLTEAAMLSAAGTAIAVDLAWFGSDALIRMIAAGRGRGPSPVALTQVRVAPDGRLLLFTGGIALLTTILFGLAGAWPALAGAPATAFRERSADGRSRLRAGGGLVVAQLALSIALLSSAAIFVRHLSNLRNVDLGFDRQSVLLMTLEPADPTATRAQLTAEYRDLLDRLGQMPQVSAASVSAHTPINPGAASQFIDVEGAPSRGDSRRMSENWVSPGYFTTFRTPFLVGRDFGTEDDAGRPVAIVDEALAHYYFPTAPISTLVGRHLRLQDGHRRYEIVGVVGNAKYHDLHEPPPPTVYFDAFQERIGSSFGVRTVVSPAAFSADARRLAGQVAKRSQVGEMTTLSAQLDDSIVPERVTAALAMVFGAVGALLAALGVYGLLAFTIARRTSEIGIRMALGATRGDILRMVLGNALALVSVGLAAGVPLAIWSGRVAASLVPNLGVRWFDVIGLAAAALSCVALVAATVPARRASRVQPMEALRHS